MNHNGLNIFLFKFDWVSTFDILKDKIVEKTEAKVAIIQICSQYSGKTLIGILHPKKFGFITSDRMEAIITPIPIERKQTILVKIKIFNSSKRMT